MRNTLASAGVWNRNTCYLATPIPIRQNLPLPLNIGVNTFAFLVGTRVEEETNQFCEALGVVGLNAALFVGHSFRIGAATSAAAAGVEDARWGVQRTCATSGCRGRAMPTSWSVWRHSRSDFLLRQNLYVVG